MPATEGEGSPPSQSIPRSPPRSNAHTAVATAARGGYGVAESREDAGPVRALSATVPRPEGE